MLVARGSGLFVMFPMFTGMPDVERVIPGSHQGIGFLGAGTIIKQHDEEDVVGLMTAAGVWMTSDIGVACDLGQRWTAFVAAVLAFVVLGVLQRFGKTEGSEEP
jgi:putative Mg2+ transporter-C (MgtC) family protein